MMPGNRAALRNSWRLNTWRSAVVVLLFAAGLLGTTSTAGAASAISGCSATNLALGKVPTTSTMGSIVAAVQVQEAVKLLHRDFANALVGKRLVVNANINDFYITGADRKPDCMAHARYGAVTELETLSVEKASARDLLKRFRQETGQDGAVSLGREIVFELRCGKCGIAERLGRPIYVIHEEQMRCSQCGSVRQRGMTHSVSSDDPWAEWPLSRLGIPRLEAPARKSGPQIRFPHRAQAWRRLRHSLCRP